MGAADYSCTCEGQQGGYGQALPNIRGECHAYIHDRSFSYFIRLSGTL